MREKAKVVKPCAAWYRVAQMVCGVVARTVFRRRVLRNEIKHAKDAFVVVANHQCALDFVNLIGLCPRPMTFVISKAFFSTLPIGGILRKLAVIPKQQFQTGLADLRRMKAVVQAGEPLVVYPAGLMCEDGLSTPIPADTYSFLKWLDCDVYVAKNEGSYFVMPKWAKGIRPGRTEIDVYRLFTQKQLRETDVDEVRRITDEALLFDAYRKQEQMRTKYVGGDDVRGLQYVLCVCPHCGKEYTLQPKGKNTLCCTACGYALKSDRCGLLTRVSDFGPEHRYVSDIARGIYEGMLRQVRDGSITTLSADADILLLDAQKHRFVPAGSGCVTVGGQRVKLQGTLQGEPFSLDIDAVNFPTLPFSPGKSLDIQHAGEIYRLHLHDPRVGMKLINLIKIMSQLRAEAAAQ